MTEPLNLTATISAEPIEVGEGPEPENVLTIRIQNDGPDIRQGDESLGIRLACPLGPQAQALFQGADDAQHTTVALGDGWSSRWSAPQANTIGLELEREADLWLGAGESLTVQMRRVISKTQPGQAAVGISVLATPYGQPPRELWWRDRPLIVDKKDPESGIVFFLATPPSDVLHLPGDPVTLEWHTVGLEKLKLKKDGFEHHDAKLDAKETVYAGPDQDAWYTLTGLRGDTPVEKRLQIRVLKQGCWNILPPPRAENAGAPADKGAPPEPLLLLKASDKKLYGIFRHRADDGGWVRLFETGNPLAGWTPVEGGGLDSQACPTSPGVVFDDKLWLVGGSQIEQEQTSNEVWCFATDPKAVGPKWKRLDKATFPEKMAARMGHGVVVYKGRIWVMGGRDPDGKALNDVWALDPKTSQWERQGNEEEEKKTRWSPRCLIAPAVQETQKGPVIWLYGGANEPLGAELFSDLWRYDGGAWEKVELEDPPATRPIASGLQTFQRYLTILGTLSGRGVQFGYQLTDPYRNRGNHFETAGLTQFGPRGADTFSYQLVAFGTQLLIARALGFEADKPDPDRDYLMIYVSRKAGAA